MRPQLAGVVAPKVALTSGTARGASSPYDDPSLVLTNANGPMGEVLAIHAAGHTTVVREVRPLTEVNQAIADVEAGRVEGRLVFDVQC